MAHALKRVTLAWPNRIEQATVQGGNWLATLPLENIQKMPYARAARSDGELINYPDSTNYIKYSEQISNANWGKVGVTVSDNQREDENGNLVLEKVVETISGGGHYVEQYPGTLAADASTLSVKVAAAEKSKVRLERFSRPTTSIWAGVSFDAATGLFSAPSSSGGATQTYGAIDLGDGLWRIWQKVILGGADVDCYARIATLNAAGSSSYTGDGASGIYIGAAQFEPEDLSDYKLTTATAVSDTLSSKFDIMLDKSRSIGVLALAAHNLSPKAALRVRAYTNYENNTWSFDTSVKTKKNYLLTAQGSTPRGVFFSSDGTKMYVIFDAGLSGTNNTYMQSKNLAVSPWVQNIGGAWTSAASTDITDPQGENAHVTKFTATATPNPLFARQTIPSVNAGQRTGSMYIYVPSGQGVTSFQYNTDYNDTDTGSTGSSTTLDAWVKVSSTATLTAARTVVDSNIKVNGGSTPSAGFIFYAAWAHEKIGASTDNFISTGPANNQNEDRVYQYTLSTPWDVSTATYANKFVSVSTNSSTGSGLYFKPDGTKMYVADANTHQIYQYALSTAWDVSTAAYEPNKRLVPGFSSSLRSVQINAAGTTLMIGGFSDDSVRQYTLSTAWDISTATYASKTFSVAAQATDARGVGFKQDGTKMYVSGRDGTGLGDNYLHQYTLSTAWDISTASYDNVLMSWTDDTTPGQIFWRYDGRSYFVVGGSTGRIYQSDLEIDPVYDSGRINAWPANYLPEAYEFGDYGFWESGGNLPDQATNYTPLTTVFFGDSYDVRKISVEIYDAENNDGYVKLGRAFVADVWQPDYTASRGIEHGMVTNTTTDQARDGTEYHDVKRPKRTVKFDLKYLTMAEAFQQLYPMDRDQGIDKEILYAYEIDPSGEFYHRTFIGRQQELNPIVHPFPLINRKTINLLEII